MILGSPSIWGCSSSGSKKIPWVQQKYMSKKSSHRVQETFFSTWVLCPEVRSKKNEIRPGPKTIYIQVKEKVPRSKKYASHIKYYKMTLLVISRSCLTIPARGLDQNSVITLLGGSGRTSKVDDNHIWLVVYRPTPPKNMRIRQLGWFFHSQLNGKIEFMFQTTNQIFIYQSLMIIHLLILRGLTNQPELSRYLKMILQVIPIILEDISTINSINHRTMEVFPLKLPLTLDFPASHLWLRKGISTINPTSIGIMFTNLANELGNNVHQHLLK